MDVMFVNKLAFFVTVSRIIKFTTVQYITDRKAPTLIDAIKNVVNIYSTAGFRIITILADGEFKHLKGKCMELGINLNNTSANEHVPEVERMIRVIKERVRALRSSLPFRKIPKRMIIEMILFSVFWLNHMPNRNGISDTLSPRLIMTGTQANFKTDCRLPFGAYAHTREENTPTNDVNVPRTLGAICLGPVGNRQGGYKFLNLSTGKLVTRRAFTEVPMPKEIIRIVEALGTNDKQPSSLEFSDRHLRPFGDEDDLDDIMPPSDADVTGVEYTPEPETEPTQEPDPEDPFEDDASVANALEQNEIEVAHDRISRAIPGLASPETMENENETNTRTSGDILDPNLEADLTTGVDDDPTPAQDDLTAGVGDEPMLTLEDPQDENKDNDKSGTISEIDESEEEDSIQDDGEIEIEKHEVYHPTSLTPSVQRTYGLRPRKKRQYSYAHQALTHVILTQYSLKKGLEKFQEKGEKAVSDELKQLHDKGTFVPVQASDLTDAQRKNAIGSLMFLKEKRCGRLKARACANGSMQRSIYAKEDAASPTVSVESVLISCVIDALEERHVVVTDIPGAYLTADMDDFVSMKFEGRLAELMVNVNKNIYSKFLNRDKNGKAILYVVLKKALYGCVRSGLLFYKRLTKDLINYGFEINPYDSCVANKMVNGSQCTALWYVDDLKISHKDPKVVEEVLAWLENVYGEIRTSRGTKHDYLGMDIEYIGNKEVTVCMKRYMKEILEEFPMKIDGEVSTPASLFLFNVNPEAKKIEEERARAFHTAVAKLLFVVKRGRGDMITAVSFLTTWVQNPDEDDWKKLIRLLKYMKGTMDLKLTLSANGTNVLKWWVDGSYAVHHDFKSHTGGTFMMGKGAITNISTKQKLVTKSSTEAELVATNDVLPQLLLTRYFLEAQGYGVRVNKLYQDNMSAILLEKNGKWSSSKRTKHINIRYFFIKDRIDAGELTVDHCPTDNMIADIHTKALQGTKFFKFRKLILNLKEDVE